jgi:flagellar biosynthesis protein FlhA
VLPAVRVCDNVALRACEYVISIKGAEVARYELPHGFELAIPGGKAEQPQGSRQTVEPAFGIKAWWIPSDAAEKAGRNGFTIIDRASVLGTHLSELVRKHAYELVTRQETKKILDRVAIEHPKVVEELVPKLLPAATVQRVIQNLLREQVSVRDAASILEALGEAAGSIRNPVLLTEFVRQSIRRSVVRRYLNQSGELPAYYVDRSIEQMVEASSEHGEQNSVLTLPPQAIRDVVNKISRTVGTPEAPVVLLTSSGARYFIRQMLEATHRNVHLLSHNEIPPEVRILSLGTIQ